MWHQLTSVAVLAVVLLIPGTELTQPPDPNPAGLAPADVIGLVAPRSPAPSSLPAVETPIPPLSRVTPSLPSPPPPAVMPVLQADATPTGRVWTLTADTLVLHGARYHGYRTEAGVTTLRFTATEVEISDVRQRAVLVGGDEWSLSAATARLVPAGTAPIELQVQQLTGSLDVGGRVGVPISLAAPLLPDTPAAEIAALPELTVQDARARLTSITDATLTTTNTAITTGH